jgi:hypothetical protein
VRYENVKKLVLCQIISRSKSGEINFSYGNHQRVFIFGSPLHILQFITAQLAVSFRNHLQTRHPFLWENHCIYILCIFTIIFVTLMVLNSGFLQWPFFSFLLSLRSSIRKYLCICVFNYVWMYVFAEWRIHNLQGCTCQHQFFCSSHPLPLSFITTYQLFNISILPKLQIPYSSTRVAIVP